MFNFLKRKNGEIILTPSMMIEKATGIVNNAINMFKVAVDEIDKANSLLGDSKAESEAKIKNLESQLSDTHSIRNEAESSIKANIVLKEKLSQFIV